MLSDSFLKLSGGCKGAVEQNDSEKQPGKAEMELQPPDPSYLQKLQAALPKWGVWGLETKQTVMLLCIVPRSCEKEKPVLMSVSSSIFQCQGRWLQHLQAGEMQQEKGETPWERGDPSSFCERAVLRKSSTNLSLGKLHRAHKLKCDVFMNSKQSKPGGPCVTTTFAFPRLWGVGWLYKGAKHKSCRLVSPLLSIFLHSF